MSYDYYLRSAVTFRNKTVYQLRPGLFRVRVLVVSHAAAVKMEPMKVAKVIPTEKRKDLLVIMGFKFRFQKYSC